MRFNWFDRVCFAPSDDPGGPPPADPPPADPPPSDPPPSDATTLEKLLSAETYAQIKEKGYKTFEDFGKGFLNLEKKIGAARIVAPTTESSPEVWEEFWKAGGRPEAADKYDLPAVPEGLSKDDAQEEFFRKTVFGIGLNNDQAGKFHNAWSEFQIARAKEIDAATNKVMDGLRAEWATEFPAKIDSGKYAITQGAGEDAEVVMHLKLADGRYLMDHPVMARMMSSLGEKIGEAGRDPADAHFIGGITTPAAAKAEIARLTADADFQKVFMTKNHAEHDAALAKMRGLHALAAKGK